MGYATGPERQSLRVLQMRLELPTETDDGTQSTQAFQFLVAGNLAETEADVASFNETLFWAFGPSASGSSPRW